MDTYGGQRDGAGRKQDPASGPAPIAMRLPEELRLRLRQVTAALDISQAEVMEMGIALAESQLAADERE
jgi:hypothetical protein